jgi:hypothetical protein
VVAERDRVREVLEAHAVFSESRHGKASCGRAEGDDEVLVGDLELSRERLHDDRLPLLIVADDAAEDELRVRAHLTERNDDVSRLERPRCGLGQEWRVEHEVLVRDDGRATPLQQAGDVASGEASAENERAAACLASLHGSCLPRWRTRLR